MAAVGQLAGAGDLEQPAMTFRTGALSTESAAKSCGLFGPHDDSAAVAGAQRIGRQDRSRVHGSRLSVDKIADDAVVGCDIHGGIAADAHPAAAGRAGSTGVCSHELHRLSEKIDIAALTAVAGV